MNADDPLLSNDSAAKALYQKPDTLTSWRSKGVGPKYVKIGRSVFYRKSALDAWLASQERDPAAKRMA